MPIRYDRIREFLRQDEGDPPPVFVGRGTILDDILNTARLKAGRAKVTRVLQGAPGAGKSSLLKEMRKRWPGKDGDPRVVYLSSSHLPESLSLVLQEILAAGAMETEKWTKRIADILSRVNSVGFGGITLGIEGERDVSSLYELALLHPPPRWKAPVIVAVDEAQRLQKSPHSPEARFLQAIHDGETGIPLTLVLGGLSDTVATADGMQLTRIKGVHEVAPLAAPDGKTQVIDEPRAFMEGMCRHFEIAPIHHLSELHEQADLCDRWPRHLHYAAVVLAEEALRLNGDMRRFDWEGMKARTRTLRTDYYDRQRSTEMEASDILVSRVMRGLVDGMHVGELEDLVEANATDRPRERIPEGMTAAGFISHLVHQGALYRRKGGWIHSPIPSFRSHLIKAGGGAGATETSS